MLFLGPRDGMYIYFLDNPASPEHRSYTARFWSYDPVVVQGDYAYVTLRTSDVSWRDENPLQIYDISNSYNPKFVTERFPSIFSTIPFNSKSIFPAQTHKTGL
jgi:hypothetical protein